MSVESVESESVESLRALRAAVSNAEPLAAHTLARLHALALALPHNAGARVLAAQALSNAVAQRPALQHTLFEPLQRAVQRHDVRIGRLAKFVGSERGGRPACANAMR